MMESITESMMESMMSTYDEEDNKCDYLAA